LNDDADPMPKPERGTFCIVVARPLITAFCPLADGQCMWKHRQFRTCTYDEEFASSAFTSAEFAARTGLPVEDPDILDILRTTLTHTVKTGLAD
jgi:hypothetical protein